MLSAKVKIKAKGQHAQQILDQLPQLDIKTAQVKVDKKPIPSRKGDRNAGNSFGKTSH